MSWTHPREFLESASFPRPRELYRFTMLPDTYIVDNLDHSAYRVHILPARHAVLIFHGLSILLATEACPTSYPGQPPSERRRGIKNVPVTSRSFAVTVRSNIERLLTLVDPEDSVANQNRFHREKSKNHFKCRWTRIFFVQCQAETFDILKEDR
uniref:uncharacterized protein LOC117603917 isoform X1 n=1 Tax=Osmia lignaria TaxID=473952 RepID=UPI00147830C3|nr:uncharacterized protein LOC117603917 isoform X1 [Osmia lignaria]